MEVQQPGSLACIQASDIFPKKTLKADDPSLHVLFPALEGEAVEFLGATTDATLAISNYRLFISFKDSFLNIPIHLIESVELKELFFLQVNCKDARSFRIVFDNNEQCVQWLHRISPTITSSDHIEDLFCFPFYCWTMESNTNGHCNCNGESNGLCHSDGMLQYSFFDEVKRLGFNTCNADSPWRITDINSNFEICSTYPKLHVVPKSLSDSELEDVAAFRSSKRFPSIVWRHPINGAVIARCSQPEVGWLGWRNANDEKLLHEIGAACAKSIPSEDIQEIATNGDPIPNGHAPTEESSLPEEGKVMILDARSYAAAVANRAKGGGCECTEYYPNCEVEFMNLANIHGIRKSFHSLRNLCSGPQDASNWWSQLEKTNWLQSLSMLIKAAVTVVQAVDKEGKPVVVHCSDGWDRTTQIVALAELLLDPYYRTIEGFRVLVEHEWLEFGHRFADRCGHGQDFDENQRCPVFLQWLDCVHQVQRHFPCVFEFNETFLCKLVQHTYSCLFGTFLCNSELERQKNNVKTRTFSVWSLFHPRRREFRNLLYNSNSNQVLVPSYHVRSLDLWSAVYLAYPIPFTQTRDLDLSDDAPDTACCSSTSLHFPLNFSDSNLEMKSCLPTHLTSSKSDGDLLRHSSGQKDMDTPLGHINKEVNNCTSLPSSNGLSTACNGDSVEENIVTEQHNSLYYSTSEENRDGHESVSVEGTSPQDMVSSMTSSAATIIQEEPESDNNDVANTEDSVSDTIAFGRTLKEFSANSRCRQDSSSYEHLAASLNELNNTGDHDQNLDDCNNLEKTTEVDQQCRSSTETSLDTLTKEKNIQTENEKLITNQETQTNESIASLKVTSSNMYARYLDNDGLTVVQNVIQDRVRQIEILYQQQMEALRAQVLDERRRRLAGATDMGVTLRGADLNDEVCSLPDSTQSSEQPPSHGSGDESSWIEVEESDAEPTRWVPDHAVNNCANCETEFWIANRKHHCRNCGLVFCSTCSNHNLPVPSEQLYDPVRVCLSCFEQLLTIKEREKRERRQAPDMVSAVG